MGTARRAPTEKGDGRDDRAPTLARYTVNINDDDILQDPDYAGTIFSLIKKHGFRIFGIQTSPESFFGHDRLPVEKVLELASDPELYIDGRPLLWLGTDTFIQARARRLGKKQPPPAVFARLLEEFETREVRHFHYWISSDGDSDWREFVDELAAIFSLFRAFPGLGLLAHAPFTVPYPSSALFARLPADDPRLKAKLVLDAPDARFSYRVIDRLETRWPHLNNLLKNDRAGGEKGFFDFLKDKDLMAAAQLAYYFLKQEELQGPTNDPELQMARESLERSISELWQLTP